MQCVERGYVNALVSNLLETEAWPQLPAPNSAAFINFSKNEEVSDILLDLIDSLRFP